MGIRDWFSGKGGKEEPLTHNEVVSIETQISKMAEETLDAAPLVNPVAAVGLDFTDLMQKGIALANAAKAKRPDKEVIADLKKQHNRLKAKVRRDLRSLSLAVKTCKWKNSKIGKQARTIIAPLYVKMGKMAGLPEPEINAF